MKIPKLVAVWLFTFCEQIILDTKICTLLYRCILSSGVICVISTNLFDVYHSYDPETDRWKTLRPMKSARALAGCAVYKGKIYVIGIL